MSDVKNVVKQIVKSFVDQGWLFTALDISNAVKQQLPYVKHREVRDIVRDLFVVELEPQGWAKTPITVKLADGSSATALLYHDLASSWDLDTKYNDQQRAQVAVPLNAPTTAPSLPVPPAPVSEPKAVSTVSQTPSLTAQAAATPAVVWQSLFLNQPSLFPKF